MSKTTSRSRLVAAVSAASVDALVEMARTGTEGADVIELRVDAARAVDPEDVKRLRAAVTVPAIFTCRLASEGGAFSGSEPERLSLLEHAARSGFDYVDVEIAALAEPFSKAGAKLILSHHDFTGLPREPDALVERALELDADVVKIAARVTSLADALELARLGDRVRAAGAAFVPVALGPAGVSARILASRLGAAFTYAAARRGRPTGAGQLTLDDMLSLYRFGSIGPDTEIYGIVGAHALSSRSPSMHNRFFVRLGRDAVYVPFEEEDLDAFVPAAKRLGVRGLSVTHPYKETIIPFLGAVDERARRIGAVNTVVVHDGSWRGYNTDVDGVVAPLERLGDWRGARAVVVGAGGAARAAVFALERLGAGIRVLARRQERAAALAAYVSGIGGSLSELATTAWDLLINATPVGSEAGGAGDTLPVGPLDRRQCVFDMVSVPEHTPLIGMARAAGARTITGIQMLAAQAVEQARLWTGETPSCEELEASARLSAGSARYSRQVLFKEIGDEGQKRIRAGRALVVGVGALGSVSSEMLVRAGVGLVRIVDRDYVDETNLQRQSLFDEEDWRLGLPKAVAAERKLARINSDVVVEAQVNDVHAGNVRALVSGIDVIVDGTDNFETRYLLNDAAIEADIPWIYAACVGSYGMSFTVVPGRTPCLRCFMESEPPPGTSPTCDTAGIIAPVVHAVAGFQVTEALKILAGREDALAKDVVSVDVWQGRVDRFRPSEPREACPACGRRELVYLVGTGASQAVTLCGRNAVQVRPAKSRTMELDAIAERLAELGTVHVNPYLLRARLDGRELVLFKDGRAIVHGTEDPAEARSLYARYIGS